MTHLGWLYDIINQEISVFELRYYMMHESSLINFYVLNVKPERALFITVLPFAVVFLLFIPIAVRSVVDSNNSLIYGFLCALMYPPIVQFGTGYFVPQPSAQSALFLVVPLYLVITTTSEKSKRYAVLALITTIFLLFLHPLRAVNLSIGLIGGMTLLFILKFSSRTNTNYLKPKEISIYIMIILLTLFTTLFESIARHIRDYILLIIYYSGGVEGPDRVNRVSGALSHLDVSLVELFFKMFLPGFILCLISSGFILYFISSRADLDETTALYLGAFISTCIFFLFSSLFDISSSRNLIVIFTIAAITGSIGLYILFNNRPSNRDRLKKIGHVLLILLLISSLPILHSSPYIYNSNEQVTESEVMGFNTTTQYTSEEIYWSDIGFNTQRFSHVVYGVEVRHEQQILEEYHGLPTYSFVPDGFAGQQLQDKYPEGRYLPITNMDRQSNVEMLEGYRFDENDFHYLDSSSDVNKVYSNQEFSLYYVAPS